jgi:PIN domain nuclease of toxin-antitoxin system
MAKGLARSVTTVLLDTHALVWAWRQPALLSASARAAIEDQAVHVLVSAVSAYEISYKRGRDPALQSLPADVVGYSVQTGFQPTSVTAQEAAAAGDLPPIHRDPWDRILVAQAMARGVPLITADRQLRAYGVCVLW